MMIDKQKLPVRPDILTVSGCYFNLLDPTDNVIRVTDIAHALSHVCRFAGHTTEFYSVAQHCVLASLIVAPEFALAALFHDAAEAYIGDITRPLKQLLPDYKTIEERIERDIFQKLGLPPELPPEVHHADLVMLATEQRDLMPDHDDVWRQIAHIDPLPETIEPWPPFTAATYFIERYRQLVSPSMPQSLALVGMDLA